MSHSIEIDGRENAGWLVWFDAAAPWMTSIVFHLGVGLLVLFLAWAIVKTANNAIPVQPINIPTATPIDQVMPLEQLPPGSENATATEQIKRLVKEGDWPKNDPATNSNALAGTTGNFPAVGIFPGNGARTGVGDNNGTGQNGPGTLFSAGGGVGAGKGISIFGPSRAKRIVYLIDHSGSLLDNFDFLREEVKRSVGNLIFVQQFAVVAFSEDAQVLGPSDLQHAGADAKHNLADLIDGIKAMGENDGQLLPFQRGFEKAFAMKPQLIYFLTDGAFDPRLFAVIHRLNPQHAVHINTLAFVHADPRYEDQLKQLAKENGGVYKFVSEKDLGK